MPDEAIGQTDGAVLAREWMQVLALPDLGKCYMVESKDKDA